MKRSVVSLVPALMLACSSSTAPARLDIAATTTVSPTPPFTVQTLATVTNTGGKSIDINGNSCGRAILAYTTPERMGTWAWNSQNPPEVCPAVINTVHLAPGGSYQYHLSGTIPASLPSGTYYFAADVAGEWVPAGQFAK